jgi:limonene-1,2-epoxide hydrolase
MGRAEERWDALMTAWKEQDFAAIEDMYAPDAVYNEPFNPPHNGNLLIVAYLKDFLGAKSEIDTSVKRLVEADDGSTLGVEWSLSYTAAGRRWTDLPRASFLDVDEDGVITYHRDYS